MLMHCCADNERDNECNAKQGRPFVTTRSAVLTDENVGAHAHSLVRYEKIVDSKS